MVSIRQARKDWAALKNALLATQDAIAVIVCNKSWEPLGYASFSEAWAAELRDVTLASEIRPHVAFYMFQEGYGPEWVADHLKGVGSERTTIWQREWADGLTPEMAHRGQLRDRLKLELGADPDQTVVEPHVRNKRGPSAHIHIAVGATMRQEYERVAKGLGTTVEEVFLNAGAEAFRVLAAQLAGRKKPRLRSA